MEWTGPELTMRAVIPVSKLSCGGRLAQPEGAAGQEEWYRRFIEFERKQSHNADGAPVPVEGHGHSVFS